MNIDLNQLKNNKSFTIIITILTIIVIIYMIYSVYNYFKTKSIEQPYLIKEPRRANYILNTNNKSRKSSYLQFKNKTLIKSKVGYNYSYSLWLNIEDLGYNYNEPKHIFHKGPRNAKYVNPGVWLYPKNNNLMIRIDTHGNKKNMNPSQNKNLLNPLDNCDIIDIPVQRWVHLVLVLHNKTLDVYLNGKLKRSCTYDSVPKHNKNPLHITDNGGFNGKLSEFKYYNKALSSNEVYSIYKGGYDAISVYDTLSDLKPNINVNVDFSASVGDNSISASGSI
uniref:LamG-like jellyroll fold domain-containing protein n=1 Tax=viral metagenome TaxID=1070528 RepID=A0A6C0IY88_9ZZZZ